MAVMDNVELDLNLRPDVLEQRQTRLGFLLIGLLAIIIIIAPIHAVLLADLAERVDTFSVLFWAVAIISLVTGHQLWKRQLTVQGTWTVILGMVVSLGIIVWAIPDNVNSYYLVLIPVGIAAILLDWKNVPTILQISVIMVAVIALLQNSVADAFSVAAIPIIVSILTSALIYITLEDNNDLTSWAFYAHQKSERRSKMYYEQREQLTKTLFELTLANNELERLNNEIEQARIEVQRAFEVRSRFLSTMSHELRTPLNAVNNFSQIVANGILGTVNDAQVDALNKITLSGKHLLSMINDILDISKIESGALELLIEEDVDLQEELQVAIAGGEALLDDKSVELVLDIQDPLPPISCDKRRVRQVMLNLISNACKFTDEGTVTIGLHQNNGRMLFSVRDTGPGIAPEDIDAVFETFTQTSTGLKQGSGTGLGLPISRNLAEAHGGKLWVESELNAGATFYFSLPIIPHRKTRPLTQPKPPVGLKEAIAT